MSSIPILPAKKVIKTLEKLGYIQIAQKGSHIKLKKCSYPHYKVIVPNHKELARGTLKSILEQANITVDEFLKYL